VTTMTLLQPFSAAVEWTISALPLVVSCEGWGRKKPTAGNRLATHPRHDGVAVLLEIRQNHHRRQRGLGE
jgi:hypothetical protein